MVETTSYFEAYRHVLTSLQKIPSRDFPMAPYILKLSPDITPPNYVTPKTHFDFTSLLVPSNAGVSSVTMTSASTRSSSVTMKTVEFTLSYDQRNLVDKRYRQVTLMDQSQWPSSAELHLNAKQYQALVLALTKKVALIQGPPGTFSFVFAPLLCIHDSFETVKFIQRPFFCLVVSRIKVRSQGLEVELFYGGHGLQQSVWLLYVDLHR